MSAAEVLDPDAQAEPVAREEQLALRSTVRDLVAAFTEAENTVRVAFRMLVDAEARLNHVFRGAEYGSISIEAGRYGTRFNDPEETIEKLARGAWRVIVERLELKRMMSVKRWEALQHTLDREKLPPITEENVVAFAEQHLASLGEMLTEAVGEVYEWLRPWSGSKAAQYKTNPKLEIERRVVLTWMVEPGYKAGHLHVRYGRSSQQLTALENVFSALDGRGSISKGYHSLLETAVNETPCGEQGETAYFRFRAYRNGNLHVEFKRLDLLKRFNQVAGGRRLKPEAE